MSAIRTIALVIIIGPASAMLAEPFWEHAFDIAEADSERLAAPVMNWIADNTTGLFALMAFGAGIWMHYFFDKLIQADRVASLRFKALTDELLEMEVLLSESLRHWEKAGDQVGLWRAYDHGLYDALHKELLNLNIEVPHPSLWANAKFSTQNTRELKNLLANLAGLSKFGQLTSARKYGEQGSTSLYLKFDLVDSE